MTEATLIEALADAPFGVLVVELDVGLPATEIRVVWTNRAHEILTGFARGVSAGRRVLELFPTFSRDRLEAGAECIADGVSRTLTDPPAEIFHVGGRQAAIVFETPRPWEVEASRSIDAIIEDLPAMVFLKDADGRFERWNRAAEELTGWPRAAVIGKTSHELFPKARADEMAAVDREVLRTGELVDVPAETIAGARGERVLHTRKIPIAGRYVLGVSLDVTDRVEAEAVLRADAAALADLVRAREGEVAQAISSRRRAEEALRATEAQLRQAQKLEAIGRLAGGIAHDFNNLLSVVLSYTALALEGSSDDDPRAALREDLLEIRRAGESAAELTRQLLAFSRQQVLHPQKVDLNTLLRGLERMLTRLCGDRVLLALTLAKDLHTVSADPGSLEQVVMNLVLNARDAMPSGGQLTIETANVVLDEAYVARHVGAAPGPHVMLAVSDTGVGMDPATLARIFEPFFTTKSIGRGTGLGLSTVFGIVKQSGGGIWVYSEPGRGSTFKVYLPARHDRGRAERVITPTLPSVDGGHETLMLVEDDEQVRRLAQRVLERLGYRVVTAVDGGDALRVATAHEGTLDLLVTDVVMPVMSGRAVAAELRRMRPDLRVVYMSGYTDDQTMQNGALEAGASFLQKPLTPQSLARAVRACLDAAPRRPS